VLRKASRVRPTRERSARPALRIRGSATQPSRAVKRGKVLSHKLRVRAQGRQSKTTDARMLEQRLPPVQAAHATQLGRVPRFIASAKARGKRGPPKAARPVDGARTKSTGRAFSKTKLAEKSLTNGGTLGLLAVGARQVHRLGSFHRATGEVLGVAAPVALAIGSFYRLTHAGSGEERVDAAHGLLWAAQGGADLGSSAAQGWVTAGVATGVAGGGLQVGVGIYRLYTGWKARSLPRMISGALDLTAGSAWALSAVSVATPVTMGVFIGATAAKMVYENRAAIARGARSMGERMTRWFSGFLGRPPSLALAAK